ncbi:MAG: hypothetical protein ABR880_12845 [Candidatus Sulfotelmatobacter sp.]|jgi:ABC-type Fe3+ transport system permease subunit
MSLPALILAVLVFAALCALVGYVLHGVSQDAKSRLIEDPEKLSLGRRRTRAVITGILFFFPAFFLSLPLTVMWARHHWPGDGQAVFGAFWPSVGIAVISAICCGIYLLMKVNVENESGKEHFLR